MGNLFLAKSAGSISIIAVMIAVFVTIMVAVGLYARKKAKSVDEFVLGGRKVGPWFTAFSYGTAYFSAVIFVGYAGQFGYLFGIASTWIGIGNAVLGSLLAWVTLGRRTRIMTQHMGTKTMSDYFGKRYNSKAIKIASALIIFIFMIPYTASLFNGLSRLFTVAFGFTNENLAYIIIVCVMALFTAVYVIAGGYMATTINDFIQGIIMLIGIVAVIVAVLLNQGGLSGSLTQLFETSGWEYTSFFGAMPIFLFFVIILTSLGTWGLPQMVTKFYAIKSENDIKKGTIVSTIFALIVAGGCYFIGGFGRIFVGNNVTDYDSIIPTMIDQAIKSDFLIGLIIIMVLSASMSTLSSLVMTSSSTLTLDLIKGNIVKEEKMTEKKQMLIMRVLLAIFIIISAVIAIIQKVYNFSEIASLMGISWGVMAGAFLAPFLYGLYSKKITKSAVWTSFSVAIVIMVFSFIYKLSGWNFMVATIGSEKLDFANSIVCGSLAMIINLILVPIVSLCTYKVEVKNKMIQPEAVNKLFSCFNKKIIVNSSESLGDEREADKAEPVTQDNINESTKGQE